MEPYQNFQVMHGQCGRIVLDFPLGENFERSWNLFTEFIIELLALLTYLQGSLINSKDRVISNFTKRETFFISYNNQVLLEVISSCAPPCNLKKRPSFPLQFGQKENILGYSFKRRAYWFVLKAARVFSSHREREQFKEDGEHFAND